jgi:hypothetical protein
VATRNGTPQNSWQCSLSTYPSRDNTLTGSNASACTYAGHYANAAGNLKNREAKAEAEMVAQPTKQAGPGFRRYSWAELIHRVWNVDPQECPKCPHSGSTWGDDASQAYLKR